LKIRLAFRSAKDDIKMARMFEADEVMIMGTMSGPIAITEVDGKKIGNGQIGEVTKRLSELYGVAMTKDENLTNIFA